MRELVRAAGYSLMLFAPALLAASVILQTPWLTFAVLIGGLPFLRPLFGDACGEVPAWSEQTATLLHRLPIAGAGAVLAALAFLVARLPVVAHSTGDLAWWGGSLWASFVFASCVAHELVHRRDWLSRQIGRVLSGVIAYPLLEHEHRAHHGTSGNVTAAEWPRVDENVWQFSGRRLNRVFRSAWDGDVVAAARGGHRLAGGLPLALCAFSLTAFAFAVRGGLGGVVLYAGVTVAVLWSMQAVTYVQHWGLGTDNAPNAEEGEYGWEDRCRLQAWLTLSISYHQAHHRASAVPYYRQTPTADAPRMPAGYVVLLVASVIPPLWRAWMIPALERWKASPGSQVGAGRRLFCIVP
jgi:alkane 1-monooxygenase